MATSIPFNDMPGLAGLYFTEQQDRGVVDSAFQNALRLSQSLNTLETADKTAAERDRYVQETPWKVLDSRLSGEKSKRLIEDPNYLSNYAQQEGDIRGGQAATGRIVSETAKSKIRKENITNEAMSNLQRGLETVTNFQRELQIAQNSGPMGEARFIQYLNGLDQKDPTVQGVLEILSKIPPEGRQEAFGNLQKQLALTVASNYQDWLKGEQRAQEAWDRLDFQERNAERRHQQILARADAGEAKVELATIDRDLSILARMVKDSRAACGGR